MDEKQIRACQFCACDISTKRKDATHCGSVVCKKAYSKQRYAAYLVTRVCHRCGSDFLGTTKSIHCGCDYQKSYETYEQELRCRHCDTLMGIRIMNVTRGERKTQPAPKICTECYALASIARAERKKGALNPNWKGGREPIRKSFEQWTAEAAERMRRDNPMFNAETRRKMSTTLKNKSYSHWPKGPNHWLWKGNRKHFSILRTAIAGWRREALRRDAFACTACGNNGSRSNPLEVHHASQTFADVVQNILDSLAVENLSAVNVDSDEFANIREAVVDAHQHVAGLTLCNGCHANIDAARRIGSNF